MKYMLLINAGELDTSGGAVGCEPEDWMRFDKEINDSGVVVASESLADLVTATRVQVANDGKRTVTDGPFAETREVLGGLFVIDVPDLDVASTGRPDARDRGPVARWWSARSRSSDVDQVEEVFREERGRLLAALVRRFGDLDLAEEVASEAIEAALVRWPVDGVPPNPGGWLMTTARRKAVDRLRRDQVYAAKLAVLQVESDRAAPPSVDGQLPDERLELFFTCAHPALAAEDRGALTLRCLAGLTTPEVARAFLVPTATMAKRIVRAKTKIRDARIPFRVPGPDELPERLPGVLQVIYSVFTEGYAASSGPYLQRLDLAEEAIRLARILHRLLPKEREVTGLLSLMLLIHARRDARSGPGGEIILLEDQDRDRWDRAMITEGRGLVVAALTGGSAGPYAVQAAIAALHDEAADFAGTDWPQIVTLYDVLLAIDPSPVIALNRAAAIAMRDGPEAGLALLDELAGEPRLRDYHPFALARADLLHRLGRLPEATAAYERALSLAGAQPERDHVRRRLAAITTSTEEIR